MALRTLRAVASRRSVLPRCAQRSQVVQRAVGRQRRGWILARRSADSCAHYFFVRRACLRKRTTSRCSRHGAADVPRDAVECDAGAPAAAGAAQPRARRPREAGATRFFCCGATRTCWRRGARGALRAGRRGCWRVGRLCDAAAGASRRATEPCRAAKLPAATLSVPSTNVCRCLRLTRGRVCARARQSLAYAALAGVGATQGAAARRTRAVLLRFADERSTCRRGLLALC